MYLSFLLNTDLGHYCWTMKTELLLNSDITGKKH